MDVHNVASQRGACLLRIIPLRSTQMCIIQFLQPIKHHSFEIGWSLLTWLTLEDAGPGAVIDRWGASEPWSDQPGGLLEGRKV